VQTDEDTPQARFGFELRRLRVRAGLSVRSLAAELHRAHSGIVDYERGTRLPSVEVVEQYEDYFKLTRGTLVAKRERARVEGLDDPRDGTLDEHLGDAACPYKGLRPFQPEDAGLFFGREALVDEVLGRLASTRFVAVVGASGSGKSSFVRAGLLAQMEPAADRTSPRVALLTPGARPLDALAGAVGAATASPVSAGDLRVDPGALAHAVHGPLTIAVDQFEELFTLCEDEGERRCFVDALVGAWRDPSSPVVVMLAVRADFYGRVAAYPQLAAAVVAHQALIGPMSTADLRRAIELPAASAGLLLQPGLVETILEDLGGEPGSLPLLSHALLETFERRRRLQLTVGGYREAGGVRGAIAQTAEHTLQALPPAQRAVARSIFLSLTDVDEGAEPTGRRVDRAELAARRGPGDDGVERVLGVLADARLVSIDEHTVAVAHEALIRHWPRLRAWIEADRAELVVHRRLEQAAREWHGLDREHGAVYRGARLGAAEDWAADHPADLSALERDFLAASRATQQRATRRSRLLLGAVTIALGVSVVLGVVAYLQGRSARSQAFAARAIDAASSDPEQGLRLALQAADLGSSSLVERALRETLGAAGWTRILRGGPRSGVNDAAFSPDGGLAATVDDGGAVRLWDVRSGRLVATMHHERAVRTVRWNARGTRIVSAGEDGVTRIWDRAGRAVRTLSPRGGAVRTATFSADGMRVLTVTENGAAQVWDLARGGGPSRLEPTGVDPRDVASLSPDGNRVLAVGRAGELRVWTVAPRPRVEVLRASSDPSAIVTVGRLSPDGRRVLSGDSSGRVCLWRAVPGPASCHAEQTKTIADAAFSENGELFVTASNDGTAVIRRTADDRLVAVLSHPDGAVTAAAFDPGGTRVVTAGQDRVARVWVLAGLPERGGAPARRLTGHTDALIVARFSEDGARVLTAGDDGSARVWPARPDVGTLPGPALPRADVAFSPDSRRVLAVSRAGTAAIWDLERRARVTPAGAMAATDAGYAPCDRATGCAPWSRDSRAIAGANARGEASVWDAATGRARAVGVDGASGAAFDASSRRLAIAGIGARPAVVVSRGRGQQPGAAPRSAAEAVTSARFIGDGRRLLTVDVEGNVALTGVGGPRARASTAGATDVSADGSRVAVGDERGVLRVHEVRGGRFRATAPQGSPIAAVAFAPDGERVVAGYDDGTARVWRVGALDEPAVVLRGHRDVLLGVEFSPDGRFVLTTGSDRSARLWDPVLGTSLLILPTGEDGRATFDRESRLIAVGGPRTVEVYRCEICRPFGDLVRLARTRLPAP
jgi:WD40 repeat protein/transcriptional regulator with XRE-family HTH domain